MPTTTSTPRISARIPATLRRPSMTSFGHLICAERPVARSTVDCRGHAGDERELGRAALGRRSQQHRDEHRRAGRVLPCPSEPPPPGGLVVGRRHGALRQRPSRAATLRRLALRLVQPRLADHATRLDPHRRHLVLGRADQRVADVVREPVDLRLGEVERHPDEAGIDAVGDLRPRLERAAPRDEPRRRPSAMPSVAASSARDLEEGIDLLVGDPVLAHRHRRRVVVVERPAGRQDERILRVGLLDRRLVLDREELALAVRPRGRGRVQELRARVVERRARPLDALLLQPVVADAEPVRREVGELVPDRLRVRVLRPVAPSAARARSRSRGRRARSGAAARRRARGSRAARCS